jgi:hypothetical protein
MPLEKLSEFNALDLIVLVLATYRLSTMLANDWEAGPAGLLAKLRQRAGLLYSATGDQVVIPGSLADALMCTYCNSVWIGLIFTAIYMFLALTGFPPVILFLPLALSGASIIVIQLVNLIEQRAG